MEAKNSLIQIGKYHNMTCIGVKRDRRNQKVAFLLVKDESSLVISSIDLGHIFGGDVRNDRGISLPGKGPHEPLFACDIVRIQSLMIYTDIVEHNIVGDTKAPLL